MSDEFWEAVVGRRFVEALNDGLARAATLRARPDSPRGPADEVPPDDALARAVMASYEAALPAALPEERRGDPALRLALVRHARRVVAEALACSGAIPPPAPRRAAEGPLDAREAMVHTLLMECTALIVLEGREFPESCQPAVFIRALGSSMRRTALS